MPDTAARSLPQAIGDPGPFDEPWQAEVFALVVALHDKGLFEWSEWAEFLSAQLHRPDVAQDGSDYYVCWLRAVEALLESRGLAAPQQLDALQAAWQRAAHATPHGRPILLENDPAHTRK